MIALSNPADKTIRAQIAEAVSLIAELDFPEKWDTLIDVRPPLPSPTSPKTNPASHWIATSLLPLPNRVHNQHRRPRNCPLHLQPLARTRPLRFTIHRNQLCNIPIHVPFPPSFHTHRFPPLLFPRSLFRCIWWWEADESG